MFLLILRYEGRGGGGGGGGGGACLAASELSVLQKLRFLVFDALSFII